MMLGGRGQAVAGFLFLVGFVAWCIVATCWAAP